MPDSSKILNRLADAGEDAIQKVGEMPGVQRFLTTINTLPDRVDDLAKPKRATASKPRSAAKPAAKKSSGSSSAA